MTNDDARALVERQARAWEQRDPDAIIADFAPGAEFISPGGRWQGRQAIREAAMAFFAGVVAVRVRITRVLADGDHGAVEWTWSETRADGRTVTADDAILFDVREGKIERWREYIHWNP